MKLVSVIIPSYNKAAYTKRTIESVLNQTYSPIEIIVVDDGSTDHTAEVLAVFGNRINTVHESNGGACSARNVGIRQSKGEYIAFLDCDDLYVPEKIEQCVDYLQQHTQLGFVHTAAYFIDAQEHIISSYSHTQSQHASQLLSRLIHKNFICNSTVVARTSCLNQVGLFDESIFVPADWDMWLRLAQVADFGYIAKPLTQYRVTDNYTFNKLLQAQTEEEYVIDKFFKLNPSLKNKLGRAALSSCHLRFAQCYFLKNDVDVFRHLIKKALKTNPFNASAWVQAILALCASKTYYHILHKKIIRQTI